MMTNKTLRVSGLKPMWMVTPFTAWELLFLLLTQRSASRLPLTWTSSSSRGHSYHLKLVSRPPHFPCFSPISLAVPFLSPLLVPPHLPNLHNHWSDSWLSLDSLTFLTLLTSFHLMSQYNHRHWWNLKILNPSLNLLPIQLSSLFPIWMFKKHLTVTS